MKYYSVENYGALADGVTNDAKAIPAAIYDAEKKRRRNGCSRKRKDILFKLNRDEKEC